MRNPWRLLAVVAVMLLTAECLPAQNLDENRLLNSWYEIARLPSKPQKQCKANNSNLITRGEGKSQLRWLWVCTDAKGNTNTHGVLAKPNGHAGSGKYKVQLIPFIWSRKYQIVAVADDNSWLILGTPNHRQLWLYASTPTVEDTQFAQLQSRAESAGYKTDKLLRQPQSNPAKPTVNPNP